MKTFIVLFGLSLALAYEEAYRGFDDCGVDGWSCEHVNGRYSITYKCPRNQPNGRIWVWTARLPAGASIFTVRDCNHLEVHVDCPKGLRTTILRQFNAINITDLDFLPPIPPGVYLNDNDQIPQAPPMMNIQDVRKIRFYPGIFDKPTGACRYKFLELASISFVNVHIDRIMKNLFHNQNLDKFIMKDVVIDSIDNNAITIAADTSITGSYFPYLPGNAISIKGESISFINNTFKKIQTLGLLVRSKEFKFSKNHVEEINTQGMDALGAKIEITGNTFTHLETGAFQKMTPGYSPLSYEIASKFIYNFSDNVVNNFSPGSMHLNWDVYKKVCSEIIFQNNIFNCSCMNLGWMSVSNGLGPKISKVKEFYDIYLNTKWNKCSGHPNCLLKSVIAQIQEVCSKKTNISEICSVEDSMTTVEMTQEDGIDVTDSLSKKEEDSTVMEIQTSPNEVTEMESLLPYTENKIDDGWDATWWGYIVVVIIFKALICGVVIFVWCWYKKRKERSLVTTIYKNERTADADSLIIINEHHNELFDKQ